MEQGFDLQAYMAEGIERLMTEVLKATFHNPKESAFMLKFAAATRKASKKREKAEAEGMHVPSFLIASITSQCNLHCAGCYSRCNHATVDAEPVSQLTGEEWGRIFREAEELGISFILLAGGEPMLRRDVVEAAGKCSNILFPIFTNGTFFDEKYFDMFAKCRNLVPIMSIEGERAVTDARRGEGIYDRLITNMDEFKRRGLVFGASVTVTTANIREVTSESFLTQLSERGCKAVIFVEFVPVTEESRDLAPGDEERAYLRTELDRLRSERQEMVYVSFPGDEKSSGGCVAAGRGFFHINSHGGAEPCPFSPYSDRNVRNSSLREALNSPLFTALREGDILLDDHEGGCVLYEKRALVESLLQQEKAGGEAAAERDRQSLSEKWKELKIQPVGNGCIDMICSPDGIAAFVDFCNQSGRRIRGFTWWCHVTEGHEPCGMGGPRSEFYDGWFSEIPMDEVIRLDDNEAYRAYLTEAWPMSEGYHACYWPGFWL